MASLCSKWNGISQLSCFYKDKESDTKVQQISWNVDMQNSISRKLVNESHTIFQEFQDVCDDGVVGKSSVLSFSRQYRAVLQSCMIKLKDKMSREKREDVTEVMNGQLDIYNILEMLWHLCEVIFIECQPGSNCLTLLLEWVKWHFNEVDQYAQNVVASVDPHMHPDYWNTIYGLASQGRLSEVKDLLTHHPYKEEGRFDVFANIEELLSTMPTMEHSFGHSESTFDSKWHIWHTECAARLNNGDFAEYPELEALCQVLNGDESILLKSDICSNWYQLLVYKLLYCNPTVKTSSLKSSAVECMEQVNGVGSVTELDEIILAIMSLDVHKFMEKSSDVMTNWWFSVHLGDLLYHYGLLKTHELNYGDELRQFLLLEYGASLMSHQSLWTIGGDYLSFCSQEGRAMLENFVEKIPLENEKKALKLLHLCNQFNLVEQQQGICKSMGMKALRRQRFGVALSWCLRAKDEVFASQLTDKYLEHYMATGTFLQCDIIESLGSQMLLNSKLTFLAKYYEFHQIYMSKDYKSASSLLVSLLMSNIAPRKFWMTLLIDSLPLLQHDELMFTHEQSFELMQCLAELKLCHNITDTKNGIDWNSEKIQLLNLALCKNLSRASLLEPESIMPMR